MLESKKAPFTDKQRNRLVADMEARLVRLSERLEGAPDPFPMQRAAMRLASYYRRKQQPSDVRRVMNAWTLVVQRGADRAEPLVGASWLQELHAILMSFELAADAEGLLTRIRELGKKGASAIVPMSVRMPLDPEEMRKYVAQMLEGDVEGSSTVWCCTSLRDAPQSKLSFETLQPRLQSRS